MIADFESAASELIQEDMELAQAYTAYQEARRRLSERYRNRGFWPTSNSNNNLGKGKSSASPLGSFPRVEKVARPCKSESCRAIVGLVDVVVTGKLSAPTKGGTRLRLG